MARGYTGLDNRDYDNFLSSQGKEKELRKRHSERRNANKGYIGWHFGIGDKPVYTKSKDEFKHELTKRGLLMRDDVKRHLK